VSRQSFTAAIQIRAAPEAALIGSYFADTGVFNADAAALLALEFARVMGPWSIQGELMSGNCRAASLGNPRLSGGHVFVSHVLSGKHRLYEPSEGIFDGVVPAQDFSMADGTWGAFEVALRLSTLDLDSQGLAGGRQRDLRAGLNWNLNPSTRLMFNHVRVLVTSRGTVPALDRGRADLWQARMPLGF
jgi:phosphate-selective porin OprO/OprP